MGRKHTASEVSRRGNDLDKINFTVRLAEVPISISAIYHSTKDFCRDYLTGEEPVFSLEVTPGDIAYEREKSAREDDYEGIPIRHFSDSYLERLAVYRKIAEQINAPLIGFDKLEQGSAEEIGARDTERNYGFVFELFSCLGREEAGTFCAALEKLCNKLNKLKEEQK